MKIFGIALFVSITYFTAVGQIEFQKSFQGSCDARGNFIQQCNDSGFVLVSSTCFGIYVIRTNNFGDTIWTKTYTDTTGLYIIPYANCIRQTGDQGFLITGVLSDDGYYLKIDSVGNKQWSHHFGGEQTYFYNILQPDTGGYIISAYADGPSTNNAAYFFGVDQYGATTNFTLISSGGGGLMTFKQSLDDGIITIAYDQNLNQQYLSKFGGSLSGWSKQILYYPSAIVNLPDTGFMVASNSGLNRYNSVGDSIWSTSINIGIVADMVYVDSTGNEGFVILSRDNSSYSIFQDDENANLLLTRTDLNGNILWTKTFGGFGLDLPSNLIATSDGGYVITGSSKSVAEHNAIIFIKTDSAGNTQ